MPTYAYACTACEHRFEIVQSFADDSLTTCPQCQGRLRKLFNAVGVVFKGSGFYRNDSRNDRRSGHGGPRKSSPHGADISGTAASSESGSSSSDSSSSTSDSSSAATTTKAATTSVSRSEGSAA